MNKYWISLFTMLACLLVQEMRAQPTSRAALATAGHEAAASGIVLSWTVGQISAETRKAPDIVITEGFQQPLLQTAAIWESPEAFKLTIYPNPATHSILLQFEQMDDDLSCILYDIVGQPVYEKTVRKGVYALRIPLTDLPGGVYLLQIRNTSGEYRGLYKIVKSL